MNEWTTTPWKNSGDLVAAIKEMRESIMKSLGVPAHIAGGEPPEPRTDLDRLLAAIRRDPADDLARLACADALEEASGGDETDGRMIRSQMIRGAKYARLPGGWAAVLADCADAIRRLGAEVWIDGQRWRYDDKVGPTLDAQRFTAGVFATPELLADSTFDPSLGLVSAVSVVRGFVEHVRCPLRLWLDYGHAVVRWHPVRRVRVTDRGPVHIDRGPGFDPWVWQWHEIPEYVCRKLERGWYATEEKAFDGLSETLIEIAEEVAGVRG